MDHDLDDPAALEPGEISEFAGRAQGRQTVHASPDEVVA
jgi:hypothetical protein